MPDQIKKRILLVTTIYWSLLVYIVAALVWWFITLESQNRQMKDFKLNMLNSSVDRSHNPELFNFTVEKIKEEYRRNSIKYISEGSTFLLLILVGASFVYRAVQRQFRMQQQQQNFMMAVTHELKTPIAVARLNLETILKYQLDPVKEAKLIRMTLEETERLNNLTNNILISAQLEGGRYIQSKEELDFSDLTKDSIQNFRQRYPEQSFIQEIVPDIDVNGDPLLLQMLINNLLTNAIKYSAREKPISCKLFKKNTKLELQITDEGPGIPDDEKKNIFKKFYRLGNEETRKTQGTGLGLYLCRKIAEDHQGEIAVTDNLPRGSIFIFQMPLIDDKNKKADS